MKVLFDICHPAHFHFFKNVIRKLIKEGNDVLIISRNKEMTTELIQQHGFQHELLTKNIGRNIFGLLYELIIRDFKLARYIKKHKPDVLIAIGGTFISHAGLVTNTPSLGFYDTENAKLQNLLTYPFLTKLAVPECYNGWTPIKKTLRYAGYHELAYLSPDYFSPNYNEAINQGISDRSNNFLIRMVSWQANHDIGEKGWDFNLLDKIITKLKPSGNILISSELPLPDKYRKYLYTGDKNKIHHVMAYCKLVITESATMASESTILGVPSLYIAKTNRSYILDQESKYNLVTTINNFDWETIDLEIDKKLSVSSQEYRLKRNDLLENSVNVTDFIYQTVFQVAH